ncbi:MAG: alpha/beta hydrolase [Patescibacteria group bacterium]|nr:alpha/beta hydrolase [Patescibacteria group bacterium]
MDTNCIIVHGGPGNWLPSDNHDSGDWGWRRWTREKLNNLGINTITPAMPDPWNPKYEDYKKEFEKYPVNENTILVGHSRGCAFLVHWLGDTKQKIKKLILVAPYKIATGNNELKKIFYGFEIDPTIKDRVGEIVYFTSNNEKEEGKESLKMYQDVLGGEIISLLNHGHYTLADMGTNEFLELIKKII